MLYYNEHRCRMAGEGMDLKRTIYQDLLNWKTEDSGKVLEVNGARQVGKTYILDKFAKENYKTYIYINMVQSSGTRFLKCLESVQGEWKPGMKREEKVIHKALGLYDDRFTDCKDAIVVIDEIQESPFLHVRKKLPKSSKSLLRNLRDTLMIFWK